MSTSDETLTLEKIALRMEHGGAVARITLDDGKGNVLDHVMMESLQRALDSFREQPGIKLIVFEGRGKHFSFGASVEEHQRDTAPAMLRAFHGLFLTLRDLAIPTLARIQGQCLGGGMELAIMCDFLFADKSARFGQPEIVLGVFAPPASIILPEKIGLARATDLLLTGRSITAGEVLSMGLLNAVLRPILVILTLPVTVVTLGLFLFVINALMFWSAAGILGGFNVTGFGAALIGSLIYSVLGIVIDSALQRLFPNQ